MHAQQPALRQANKLWLSDTIHLRKTILIPLDACVKAPANEVLLDIAFDAETVTVSYQSCLPAQKPQLPALTTTLLNGISTIPRTSLSLSSPSSSRSASFDLMRLDPSANASTTSLLSRRSRTPTERSTTSAVEAFLPSTNNVFSDESLEAMEEEIKRNRLDDSPIPEATSPRPNLSEEATVLHRTLPITRQAMSPKIGSDGDGKSKSRPMPLRSPSFQLSDALASPPCTPPTPSKDDPSQKPRYTHLQPPEDPAILGSGTFRTPLRRPSSSATLTLRDIGSSFGSGNWLAADPSELAIANEIAASTRNKHRLQSRKKKGS